MSSSVRIALVLGALLGIAPAALAGSNPATQILPQTPTPPLPDESAKASAPAATVAKTARELRAARRESRRQAAIERRAARLALKAVKASPAVAKASPGDMEAGLASADKGMEAPKVAATGKGVEAPAPTPADAGAAASPREKGAPTLNELVAKHALANGVPFGLARAVVQIESRGNPHAANRGALGLMQIKYTTARAAGFSGIAAGLFVADTNLRFGMKVLGDAYRSAGGDVCGALMRYQSGHLATRPNRANRAYCSRARSIMAGA